MRSLEESKKERTAAEPIDAELYLTSAVTASTDKYLTRSTNQDGEHSQAQKGEEAT